MFSHLAEVFPSDHDLAGRAAADFRALAAAAMNDRVRFTVALSGGRISIRLFAALAAEMGPERSALRVFWADERSVPADHPDSNFLTAQRELLTPLGIPAEHVHRIAGELPPAEAAARASAALRRETACPEDAMPALELVILGMGEDGHIASLFPGHDDNLADTTSVFLPVHHSPKPPPVRVSLGMGPLLAARRVWALITGADKEAALSDALSGAGSAPFAQLLRQRRDVRIFTTCRF